MENRTYGLPRGDLDQRGPAGTPSGTPGTCSGTRTTMGTIGADGRAAWTTWTNYGRQVFQRSKRLYTRLPEHVSTGSEGDLESSDQAQEQIGPQQQRWRWTVAFLRRLGTRRVPHRQHLYHLLVILLLVAPIQPSFSAPIPDTQLDSSPFGTSDLISLPWHWVIHLAHKNRDCQAQLAEKDEILNAEPLPQPEPLEEAQIREKRFVATFLPQIDARLWDWIQQLFQGYREASEVLTPLENDTWTAEVILQAANAVSRKKRNIEPKTSVSKLLSILQMPLFSNQTLLSPILRNQTITGQEDGNSTTEFPRHRIYFQRKFIQEDPWDFGVVAIIFAIACIVASIAGLAGRRPHTKEVLLIVETGESDDGPSETGETIQDCEHCDFHLDYPLVHIPEEP